MNKENKDTMYVELKGIKTESLAKVIIPKIDYAVSNNEKNDSLEVYVTNNIFDDSPIWEECTEKAINNDIYEFKNKKAECEPGISLKVLMKKPKVENPRDNAYGVRWNTKTGEVTRLGKAIGLNASTNGVNDFDSIYPWSEVKRCNMKLKSLEIIGVEGVNGYETNYLGGSGEALVQIKKFYYMIEKDGECVDYYVSKEKLEGFELHPAFYRDLESNNNELGGKLSQVDVRYRSAMLASYLNILPMSRAEKMPKTNMTIDQARGFVKKVNPGWSLLDYNLHSAIQLLYLIEYASFNSRECIGYGYDGSDSKIKCGSTISLGNKSGNTGNKEDKDKSVSYRGMEDIWGNAEYFIDGIITNDNGKIMIGSNGFNNSGTGYEEISDTVVGQGFMSNVSLSGGGFLPTSFNDNSIGIYDKQIIEKSSIFVSGSNGDEGLFSLRSKPQNYNSANTSFVFAY